MSAYFIAYNASILCPEWLPFDSDEAARMNLPWTIARQRLPVKGTGKMHISDIAALLNPQLELVVAPWSSSVHLQCHAALSWKKNLAQEASASETAFQRCELPALWRPCLLVFETLAKAVAPQTVAETTQAVHPPLPHRPPRHLADLDAAPAAHSIVMCSGE